MPYLLRFKARRSDCFLKIDLASLLLPQSECEFPEGSTRFSHDA